MLSPIACQHSMLFFLYALICICIYVFTRLFLSFSFWLGLVIQSHYPQDLSQIHKSTFLVCVWLTYIVCVSLSLPNLYLTILLPCSFHSFFLLRCLFRHAIKDRKRTTSSEMNFGSEMKLFSISPSQTVMWKKMQIVETRFYFFHTCRNVQ